MVLRPSSCPRFLSATPQARISREVKILMRLPDGRNGATAKPFTGAHLCARTECNWSLPWCINTGKSLIPLTLRFLAQKRNLLIPLELSRVMHQGSRP